MKYLLYISLFLFILYIEAFAVQTNVKFSLDTRSANFVFSGTANAVNLAGTFNNWSTSATPMSDPDKDGVWTTTIKLNEGTYQYKFVVNSSNWFWDPDNPVYNCADNNNSIITVIHKSKPYITSINPPDGSVFFDTTSLNISAYLYKNDLNINIDPSTILVKHNDSTIPHIYEPSTGKITVSLTGLSNGEHLLTFSASDSAGNSTGEVKSIYGIYPSKTGFYYLDSYDDENYAYPTSVPVGSCDIRKINITSSSPYNNIHFSIELRDITDYTKVGILISSAIDKNFAEIYPGLEVKHPQWNGQGVLIVVMSPNSPYLDNSKDNKVYTIADPLTAGDSIVVNSNAKDINRFEFDIPLSILESAMGSYNTGWYYTIYSHIDNSQSNDVMEITSNEGGISEITEPDVYDIAFVSSVELQKKLLSNYIIKGNCLGERYSIIDNLYRGIARILPTDISDSLFNKGPQVKFLTKGYKTILPNQRVVISVSDTSIHSVILSVNGVDTTLAGSGTFTGYINLIEGQNEVKARATSSLGYTGYSSTVRYILEVDHNPKSVISMSVSGNIITLDGSKSSDPDGDNITYYWESDSRNPEPVVIDNPTSQIASFNKPTKPGEYYFDLTVRDTHNNLDRTRNYITVDEVGNVKVAGNNDHPSWVDNCIMYEIFVRSFTPSRNFKGVIDSMEKVADLGVNCIWFMPINEGPSDHGYEITDYYAIESDYGTMNDFSIVKNYAKYYGLKVIIDHVVNHTSIQHPFMVDLVLNGQYSPYYDWYRHSCFSGEASWVYGCYLASGGLYTYYADWRSLPNINHDNPEMSKYLIDMAKYWIGAVGVDGFRCDIARGVQERSPTYWVDWRKAIKSIKPEILLLAEAPADIQAYFYQRFDSAYDWNFYWNGLRKIAETGTIDELHNVSVISPYLPSNAMPFRFMENHDEDRYIAKYGVSKTKVAAVLLFTVPGIPLIYAGQEVGEKTQRNQIDWSDPNKLRPFYKKLVNIRKSYPALRSRNLTRITNNASAVYSFLRPKSKPSEHNVITVINFSSLSKTVTLQIPTTSMGLNDSTIYYLNDVLNDTVYAGTGAQLANYTTSLAPRTAKIFVVADSAIVSVPGNYAKQVEALPLHFSLEQNYPNPFNPMTTIRYGIAVSGENESLVPRHPSPVTLKIYNITGQLVKTLVDKKQPAGYYSVIWDGRDDNGHYVPSGIYLYRITMGDFSATKRMILMK